MQAVELKEQLFAMFNEIQQSQTMPKIERMPWIYHGENNVIESAKRLLNTLVLEEVNNDAGSGFGFDRESERQNAAIPDHR